MTAISTRSSGLLIRRAACAVFRCPGGASADPAPTSVSSAADGCALTILVPAEVMLGLTVVLVLWMSEHGIAAAVAAGVFAVPALAAAASFFRGGRPHTGAAHVMVALFFVTLAVHTAG